MDLTTRPSKLDAMKAGSSLRVIILALLKTEHLQRLALNFNCPAELYGYIYNSKKIKQLLWTKLASKMNGPGRSQCRLEAVEFSDIGKKYSIPDGIGSDSEVIIAGTSTTSGHSL